MTGKSTAMMCCGRRMIMAWRTVRAIEECQPQRARGPYQEKENLEPRTRADRGSYLIPGAHVLLW